MRKFFWSTTLLFLTAALTATMVTADERTTIELDAIERDFVLSEMRVFLQSIQEITYGLANDDMDLIATSAKKSGRNAQASTPPSLGGKLPPAFKKLGFNTHMRFDELALDADQLGDNEHTLTQLSALLKNCVSCHASFKFALTTAH